ncbi:MAG TPA: LLM class flavin-dependent oxidoreductase, partial [Acidimicrobiales bacterium]|nr:LLM class flavin-dependent oxidoreductase [Acidimicrobiales bacterium]
LGRFSFGVGLGGRPADFAVAPQEWAGRGQRFEQQLLAMKRAWRGEPPYPGTEPIGPVPITPGGPELIIGGFAPAALERAGRLADGIRSFSFSTDVGQHLDRLAVTAEAWKRAGRAGQPRLITATHYALGTGARESYEAHVHRYYGYSSELMEDALSGDAPTSPDAIRSTIRRFADAGVDELVFTATTSDTMDSLDRLADAVAGA